MTVAEVRVKICGLTDAGTLEAAVTAGAGYLGFVFFPKSPRNIAVEAARDLAASVPPGICKVALMVNPSDAALGAVLDRVPIDMLQLHGGESPERVAEIKAQSGLPVMKAVGVAAATDLAALDVYAAVADQILVDAKPAKGADLPGGNGLAFDWRLIAGRDWGTVPWMLAGGLTPENVAQAVELTGAAQVDVSSGVEARPGVKDTAKIQAFLAAAKGVRGAGTRGA